MAVALLQRNRHIKNREQQEPLGSNIPRAKVPLRGYIPLSSYPPGDKDGCQQGLWPLAQDQPGHGSANGPKQEPARPMLFKIEDLSGKKNSPTQCRGPGTVKCHAQGV